MSISVILRFIGLDRGDVAVMLSIFFCPSDGRGYECPAQWA
jgi:hypothetical protein